jgi:hypothetical protein
MAQILLRLEKKADATKTTPAHTDYYEFHLLSGNRVQRLWPLYKNGRPTAMKETENFQSTDLLKGYVANMRALYEKQGYKAVSGEWLAQEGSKKSSKSAKGSKVAAPTPSAPVVSKTPGMGELPAGALEAGTATK